MEDEQDLAGLSSEDTVTRQEVAQALWDRYSQRLLTLAARNLDIRVRARVDEEDVVQSMYKSFCLRAQNNEFKLDDANDVWALLATMTIRKAKKAAAKQRAKKRSVSTEVDLNHPDQTRKPEFASDEPTPEEIAVAEDEITTRLAELPDDLKNIVRWKLEGYKNSEIAAADKLDCSERTIERKLHLLRRIWV